MNLTKKTFFSVLYAISMKMLTGIKLSFILGSQFSFFSLNQCLTPLSGMFGGPAIQVLIFMARSFIHMATFGLGIGSFMYHIPTLSGALYLSSSSRLIRALPTAVCIALFLLHPVGAACWFYTLYWMPPLFLSMFTLRSIFLRSLGSTLTTHAIGSILWLYSHHTEPAFWYSLATIVWLERLIFALFLTSAYYGILCVKNMLSQYQQRGVLHE